MENLRRTIHNILVWSYERGTLQYDIICALILAFIFLVPPSCFVAKRPGNIIQAHSNATVADPGVKTVQNR